VIVVIERNTFNKEMELLTATVDEIPVPSIARRDLGSITFPSGESLSVINGPVGEGEEHYDQLKSGNPLLDTSGSNKLKYLSKNFTVGDFAKSGKKVFDKARIDPKLVQCLQAIRDRVNIPVIITSGYRSYLYNREIYRKRRKEPTKSQHMSGRAADVKAKGISGLDLAKTAIDVCGCNVSVGLAPDFIHVDIRGKFYVWTYAGLSEIEGKRQEEEIKRYHKVRCPPPVGSSQKSTSLDNAIYKNRQYAKSLGWDKHLSHIGRLLGYTTSSPSEKQLVEAVARWQASQKYGNLSKDGIIGPATWSHMRSSLGL
jgi:uncharacterized protein YcbK (DUF882 family)